MFDVKTVFILGAGSSKEVGLPTGVELTEKIGPLLDIRFEVGRRAGVGDSTIEDALRAIANREGINVNELFRRCRQIGGGINFTTSIDNYINLHAEDPHVALCGKLAITKAILQAERGSSLFIDRETTLVPADSVTNTWFIRFVRGLSSGIQRENIGDLFKNVAIINFNYDRCIEHFLYSAVRSLYNVDGAEAAKVMSTLRIIHPYGTVGELPWQNPQRGVAFGDDTRQDLEQISSRIRTFAERIEEKTTLEAIKRELISADKRIFLGFAYYQQNMEILTTEEDWRPIHVYGTAFQTSKSDMQIISAKVRSAFSIPRAFNPVLENLTCVDFFDSYSRSLVTI